MSPPRWCFGLGNRLSAQASRLSLCETVLHSTFGFDMIRPLVDQGDTYSNIEV